MPSLLLLIIAKSNIAILNIRQLFKLEELIASSSALSSLITRDQKNLHVLLIDRTPI